MSENPRGSDLLVGLLIGAAIGAGIAILLAPAPGEETRRRLAESARRLGKDATDKLNEAKETIASRVS